MQPASPPSSTVDSIHGNEAAVACVTAQAAGKRYSPSQIGAFVLTKMKETAGAGRAAGQGSSSLHKGRGSVVSTRLCTCPCCLPLQSPI